MPNVVCQTFLCQMSMFLVKCQLCLSNVFLTKVYVHNQMFCQMSNVLCQMSMFLVKSLFDQCLCSLSNVKCCLSNVFLTNVYVPCQMSNVVCQTFLCPMSMFLVKRQMLFVKRFCVQCLCSLSNVKCCL